MSTGICHLCTKPGQCCEYLELPVFKVISDSDRLLCLSLARALTEDERNWVNLHDGLASWTPYSADGIHRMEVLSVDHEVVPRTAIKRVSHDKDWPYTVHIESRCKALVPETGLCGLYGNDERPEMCSRWPDAPESQAPEGCAYLTPEHRALIQAEALPLPS